MGIRPKLLGAGLLATLALSALAVFSASAETGGHFTSDKDHTILIGKSVVKEQITSPTLEEELECEAPEGTSLHGTWNKNTETEITFTSTVNECEAEFDSEVPVTMNGCDYLFTIRKTEPEKQHSTVHLKCPDGKVIELHVDPPIVGTCKITIPPQTPKKGGVVYEKVIIETTDSIRLNITVEDLHYSAHETGTGCLGKGGSGTLTDGVLTGTIDIKGKTQNGGGANIKATGS